MIIIKCDKCGFEKEYDMKIGFFTILKHFFIYSIVLDLASIPKTTVCAKCHKENGGEFDPDNYETIPLSDLMATFDASKELGLNIDDSKNQVVH